MLVFALDAQSVQEVLKTMLMVRSRTLLGAITGLIREATRANRQWTIDADAIITQVIRRLGALGQHGIRKGALRLDAISPGQLEDLVASVEPADVPGLPGDRGGGPGHTQTLRNGGRSLDYTGFRNVILGMGCGYQAFGAAGRCEVAPGGARAMIPGGFPQSSPISDSSTCESTWLIDPAATCPAP